MTCREWERRLALLEDFANGEAAQAERAEVAAHLETCAACRSAVGDARLASAMLAEALEPAAVPTGFSRTRMDALLRAEEERQRESLEFWPALERLASRLAWGSAMALVTLLAFVAGLQIGVYWPQSRQTETRDAEVREMVPRPVQLPADHEEVLATLVADGNGR